MSCCCGVIAGVIAGGKLNATGPLVLDSTTITDLVRGAGGNANALFRASLAWNSWSDVDFHLREPSGGYIVYSNRVSEATGGELDVDMNVGSKPQATNSNKYSKPAVENIVYTDLERMPNGDYVLSFVQYGVDWARAAGADRPYLLLEHRTSDEEPMSHYVLLKNNGVNAEKDRGTNHSLATVRKTGDAFKLVSLAPNTVILEVHNFDVGQYGVGGSTTGNTTETAATTGENPTGG